MIISTNPGQYNCSLHVHFLLPRTKANQSITVANDGTSAHDLFPASKYSDFEGSELKFAFYVNVGFGASVNQIRLDDGSEVVAGRAIDLNDIFEDTLNFRAR